MRALGVVGALLAFGASLAAADSDVAGKWKGEFSLPDGQAAHNVFTFEVSGETLTGSVYSSLAGSEAPIQNGTVTGDALEFTIVRSFGGSDVTLRYKGALAGDEIAFLVAAGEGAQAFELRMTAKREP
jgi:hypothetical protein